MHHPRSFLIQSALSQMGSYPKRRIKMKNSPVQINFTLTADWVDASDPMAIASLERDVRRFSDDLLTKYRHNGLEKITTSLKKEFA